MSDQDPKITDRPVQPMKKRTTLWITISLVILLLFCLCVVTAAALIYFDPFDWGILGRLFGGYDSIAGTIPANTDMHVSVDMLKLLSPDSQAVFDAFAKSSDDPAVSTRAEAIQKIDEMLMDEFGVTFTDDIQPWIGQYASLSLFDIEIAQSSNSGKWVYAVEARDKGDADAFISKFTAHLSMDLGTDVQTSKYKGATLYALEDAVNPLAIGRHNNIIFLSTEISSIQQAIDAREGASLAENENYQSAIAKLPSSRLVTAYLSQNLSSQLTTLAGGVMLGGKGDPVNNQNLGLALSLIDEGIQADIVAVYDLEALSQSQIDSLSLPGAEGKLAEEMQEDIVLYLTGRDLSKAWENLISYLQTSAGMDAGEISESMRLLEDEIGINPERDLFPYLDGEWAIGLIRERGTLLALQLDVPVGLLCIGETSSPNPLSENVSDIAANLRQLGLVTVEEKALGDMTLYEASAFLLGNPLLTFGTRQNQFLLSTHPSRLENPVDPGTGLAQTPAWKNIWQPMPPGMNPILYLDVQSFISLLPDFPLSDISYLQPIQTLALAGSPLNYDTKQWVLLLSVSTEQ